MPLIEKISQMQKQGLTSEQIIQRLKEEGTSPREIDEALNQSQVKSAVSSNMPNAKMEPSVMTAPQTTPQAALPQAPYPSQQFQTGPPPYPQEPLPQQVPQEPVTQPLTQEISEYPQESYGYESYYPEYQYPLQQMDTEIIAEISEQVVAERLEKIQKQLSETVKLKTEIGGKVKDIDERLKRIELTIHTLQTAILKKIGGYGRDLEDIRSELETTQESFSKVLSPRKTTKKKTEKTTKRGRKKKDGFESYLRR